MSEDHHTENWRAVVGFEGWYEVSDLGRLRRIRPGKRTSVGRVRAETLNECGYVVDNLSIPGNKRRTTKRHTLVAEAFIGPRPSGLEINHKNGIKTDNKPANLEWCTRRENVVHSVAVLGRRLGNRGPRAGHPGRAGIANPNAKLNEDAVRELRKMRANGVAVAKIAKRFGVSSTLVSQILRGIGWKHVV